MALISAATFDQLFSIHYKRVRNYVMSLCGNSSDAEDITQDAFIRAYRLYETFDQRSPFEVWIKVIARNQYLSLLRRRRSRVTTITPEGEGFEDPMDRAPAKDISPEEILIRKETDPILAASLSQLSSSDQMILKMIAVEERPYADVAIQLGVPLGTVKSRYSRLLKVARSKYTSVHLQREYVGANS